MKVERKDHFRPVVEPKLHARLAPGDWFRQQNNVAQAVGDDDAEPVGELLFAGKVTMVANLRTSSG